MYGGTWWNILIDPFWAVLSSDKFSKKFSAKQQFAPVLKMLRCMIYLHVGRPRQLLCYTCDCFQQQEGQEQIFFKGFVSSDWCLPFLLSMWEPPYCQFEHDKTCFGANSTTFRSRMFMWMSDSYLLHCPPTDTPWQNAPCPFFDASVWIVSRGKYYTIARLFTHHFNSFAEF